MYEQYEEEWPSRREVNTNFDETYVDRQWKIERDMAEVDQIKKNLVMSAHAILKQKQVNPQPHTQPEPTIDDDKPSPSSYPARTDSARMWLRFPCR